MRRLVVGAGSPPPRARSRVGAAGADWLAGARAGRAAAARGGLVTPKLGLGLNALRRAPPARPPPHVPGWRPP